MENLKQLFDFTPLQSEGRGKFSHYADGTMSIHLKDGKRKQSNYSLSLLSFANKNKWDVSKRISCNIGFNKDVVVIEITETGDYLCSKSSVQLSHKAVVYKIHEVLNLKKGVKHSFKLVKLSENLYKIEII